LAQAAQGSGGVPIPGGVQKRCGCGPWGHGWAGMVGLGWRLDLMILEVFSNLNDSLILYDLNTSYWYVEDKKKSEQFPTFWTQRRGVNFAQPASLSVGVSERWGMSVCLACCTSSWLKIAVSARRGCPGLKVALNTSQAAVDSE